MSEAEIIQKLIHGDETAFKKLVLKYQQMIVNTSYGLVQNAEDAEDIAQDVFVEVYRSIDKFRADSKLSTWLYRIAVNRSLNFLRDNRKRKWFQSFEDVVKNKISEIPKLAVAETENPEFDFENQQRANLLHEAISTLPENQKVTFTLNKYEDLSYKEISEVMDLSVSSVESLIHRAKKNLQKKLYACYKKKCI